MRLTRGPKGNCNSASSPTQVFLLQLKFRFITKSIYYWKISTFPCLLRLLRWWKIKLMITPQLLVNVCEKRRFRRKFFFTFRFQHRFFLAENCSVECLSREHFSRGFPLTKRKIVLNRNPAFLLIFISIEHRRAASFYKNLDEKVFWWRQWVIV